MSRYVDDVAGGFITHALQTYQELKLVRCRTFAGTVHGVVHIVLRYADYPVLFNAEIDFNEVGVVEYVTVNGSQPFSGHAALWSEVDTFVKVASGNE